MANIETSNHEFPINLCTTYEIVHPSCGIEAENIEQKEKEKKCVGQFIIF